MQATTQDRQRPIDQPHPYRPIDPFSASIRLGIRNNSRSGTINSINDIGLPQQSYARHSRPAQEYPPAPSRQNPQTTQSLPHNQTLVQNAHRAHSLGLDIPRVANSPEPFDTSPYAATQPSPLQGNGGPTSYQEPQTPFGRTGTYDLESQSSVQNLPRQVRRNALDSTGIMTWASGTPGDVGLESQNLAPIEEDPNSLPFTPNGTPGYPLHPSLQYRPAAYSPATEYFSPRRSSYAFPRHRGRGWSFESLFWPQWRTTHLDNSGSPAENINVNEPPLKIYIITFLFSILPRQIYLHCLLRLPYMYYSRVNEIFLDAHLTMEDIKDVALRTAAENNMTYQKRFGAQAVLPGAYRRLKENWELFIDNLMREWKTLNIISGLLLSGILTVFQIQGADSDPITRYCAFWSLICALLSLLYGCFFIVRFSSMRKVYKAAEWAIEAQHSQTMFWNVWVMLAMPAIWLVWSILAYIACIMSFMWRVHPDLLGNVALPRVSPVTDLALRIFICGVFGVGVVYAILIINTLRRYGTRMDKAWSERITRFIQDQPTQQLTPDLTMSSPPVQGVDIVPPTPPQQFGALFAPTTMTGSPPGQPFIPPRPPMSPSLSRRPNRSSPLVDSHPQLSQLDMVNLPTRPKPLGYHHPSTLGMDTPTRPMRRRRSETTMSPDRHSDQLLAESEGISDLSLDDGRGELEQRSPISEIGDSPTIDELQGAEASNRKSMSYKPSDDSEGSLDGPLSPLVLRHSSVPVRSFGDVGRESGGYRPEERARDVFDREDAPKSATGLISDDQSDLRSVPMPRTPDPPDDAGLHHT